MLYYYFFLNHSLICNSILLVYLDKIPNIDIISNVYNDLQNKVDIYSSTSRVIRKNHVNNKTTILSIKVWKIKNMFCVNKIYLYKIVQHLSV